MSFIDLHVHTTASDGTFTPAEVVEYARKKGLSALAITDHDTIAGIPEALMAAEKNREMVKKNEQWPEIVPGVEISCIYEGIEIHMLGLMIDWQDKQFDKRLSDMRKKRESRNERMIERMQKDHIPITMDKLLFGEEDTVITRAHFARFLEQEGYVKSKEEAFQKYVGIGCPYYIPREYISPEKAIGWIQEAKGFAFLAHPYLYGFSESQVRKMIQFLKDKGMNGLEAYHSSASQGQTSQLRQYAAQYGLLVSGGSDFHGSNKADVDLGCGRGGLRITDFVYEKIKGAKNAVLNHSSLA